MIEVLSCSAWYDSSPVLSRSIEALKDRIIGEKVSGKKRPAMMKAAPDIISVVQSIHLQLAQSTIQPFAMGAIIGPVGPSQ